MAQVRSALRSTSVRVAAAAMLLLGLVTITPMLSGAASAHRAHLDAEVSCDGQVSWTATSWSKSDDGSNDDVRIHRSSDGGDAQEVGHGSFSGDDGYSFAGHFSWPEGAEKLVVSTEPMSKWGNGEEPDQEGHDEVELEKPDCDGDAHVEHELQCEDSAPGYGDGEVTLTLSNPAGPFAHDVTFDVYDPDQEDSHQSYTVHAGEEQHVSYHDLSDGHHHIKVMKDDEDHSRDVEVDCDQQVPSVTASQACVNGDGAVTVNLFNTGGEAVTFTVEHPVTHAAEQISVDPNGSASRTFSGLADGEYEVKVTSGEADLSQEFEVDCDHEVEPPLPPVECEAETPTSTTVDEHEPSTTDGETSSTEHETSSSYPGHESSSTSSSVESNPYSRSFTNSYTTTTVHSTSTTEHATTTTTANTGSSYPGTTDDHASSTTDEHETSTSEGHHDTSTTVDEPDDEHCPPPVDGQGTIQVAKVCADQDGTVTVTMTALGAPVRFVVEGTSYLVQPGSPQQAVISGLTDGTHTIHVMAGKQDLSFDVQISCDLSPRITVTQECRAFDGAVSFLLENLGDDKDATFTIDGVDHVVAPGASTTVVIDGLSDGEHTFVVAINGTPVPDVVVTVDCNPVFDVVAQCNAVSATGSVDVYWFTITNTEATEVTVSWAGGSATIPAGESRTIGSISAPLSLSVGDEVVATATATDVVCSRTVIVDKQLIGGPDAPETYTVTISRLVGDAYVQVTSVPLVAGQPTTVTLPSTLDPAGIQYQVEETDRGTASTSVVSPSQITLSGHLGETVSVTVTNGYASVLIDKAASTQQVGLGGQFSYTMQGRNTGGLTLDNVVISDRLPAAVSYVTAAVAGGAGTCTLDSSARPQLFHCDLDGTLAADATTPVITVVVNVDDDTSLVGSTLTNQAKIVGDYGPVAAAARTAVEAIDPSTALSCEPVVDGQVCDLSAAVNTLIVASEPPPTTTPTTTPGTTTTTIHKGPLPRAGGDPLPLLLLALGAAGAGGLLLAARRRA